MIKTKFFFSIIILSLILIVNSNSNSKETCIEERQVWIKKLKLDLSEEIGDVVYSDNNCFIEVIKHNGISIEEHMYRIAGDNRDIFKDLNKRKTRELLNDILSF